MKKFTEEELMEQEEIRKELYESVVTWKESIKETLENSIRDSYEQLSDSEVNELYQVSEMYKYKDKFGFVYFLHNEDTGLTKIGRTENILNRMKQIQNEFKNCTGNIPNLKLSLLLFSHTSLLKKLERDVHNDLKNERHYGEWFNLQDKNLSDFFDVDDSLFLNGTYVSINDIHDFHLYEDVERDYNLNEYEVELLSNHDNFKDNTDKYPYSIFNFNINNKFAQILEVCIANNIGLSVDRYDIKKGVKRKMTIFSNNKEIYDVNKIKLESFNEQEVLKTIQLLDNKSHQHT